MKVVHQYHFTYRLVGLYESVGICNLAQVVNSVDYWFELTSDEPGLTLSVHLPYEFCLVLVRPALEGGEDNRRSFCARILHVELVGFNPT